MICLRCGYCCKMCAVIIVDDLAKGPVEGNLVTHLGGGIACPHLEGSEPGKYSCAAHVKHWYPDTPCARHGQIERDPETACRMGVHVLSQRGKELVGA